MYLNVEVLKGLTPKLITWDDSEIRFETECGRIFLMYHEQDCCESVYIEDIVGDLKGLEGSPITLAEETTNSGRDKDDWDSFTWTYYRFDNTKGNDVSIRWYGTSNGYYSESVDFKEIK